MNILEVKLILVVSWKQCVASGTCEDVGEQANYYVFMVIYPSFTQVSAFVALEWSRVADFEIGRLIVNTKLMELNGKELFYNRL